LASDTAAEQAPTASRRRSRRRRESVAPIEYHLLMLITLGLVAFGLIMVYSASSGTAVLSGRDPVSVLFKQGVYAALGIGLMAGFARFPYRRLRYWAVPVLGVVVLLLVLVLIPGIGAEINNARRWLLLGPISIQPSEFAKAAMLLFAAAVLASRRRPPSTLKELLNPVGAVVLVVCALVKIEPDLGTTIAIVLMVCGVLVVAGTPFRLFLSVTIPALLVVAYTVIREPYQMQRITTFLDPQKDPQATGYQVIQAMYGLGSGGWTGVGLGNGTQKSYTPEASTDMIASVIGEELGLLGILVTVLAFAAFAVLGFRIAMRCKDPFGKYLVAGATCLVAGQAFVNLGAVLGVLPLTGVPLPLISSGGSSLVVMLALVGVMLNVADSEAAGATSRSRKGRTTTTDAKPKASDKRAATGAGRSRRHGGARRPGAGGGRRAVG
jgi:cell division protein FtsW